MKIMFDQFYGNSVFPRSFFSSYFVVLIPKVDEPFALKDYLHISLFGCHYKLILNVFAAHLAMVLNSVIATSQSTLFKGRNLVDGVMVINEVVDLAKKLRKSEFLKGV